MRETLGIDVGGTGIKMGVVDADGRIHHFEHYVTLEWRESGDFVGRMIEAIRKQFRATPGVSRIGIGVPGTLSKDRRTLMELPNIPELNGVPLATHLEAAFPGVLVRLENDANAAALGEYFFADDPLPDDYMFITLGTGVGGAAIVDRRVFLGGDGNSMEIGHIVSRYERRLESNIGKRGILTMAAALLNDHWGQTAMVQHKDEVITSGKLIQAAGKGDPLALKVLAEVGEILGEGLVSAIRILDIKTILIGGGLSVSYPYIRDSMHQTFRRYLTPYYLDGLTLRLAQLGNDAGVLGAASLCFEVDDCSRHLAG
ncbi:MAG: ROK family protein [Catalinimonas sp.]